MGVLAWQITTVELQSLSTTLKAYAWQQCRHDLEEQSKNTVASDLQCQDGPRITGADRADGRKNGSAHGSPTQAV